MHSAATPHLNLLGCEIRETKNKGRGVFATQDIPAQTIIDISPVLLFSKEEYDQHGKHTVLDQYTFKWRDGRMALALGLGSIFNHSTNPNLSYIIDVQHTCIRYMTMRNVSPGDELCIFYGTNLWFEDVSSQSLTPSRTLSDNEDLWDSLVNLELDQEGDDQELIPQNELPFEKFVSNTEEDEEELSDIVNTVDAWVVDIPNPRKTSELIQWMKQADLEHPSLKHAKHIRRREDSGVSITTLLLTPAEEPPPIVPGGLIPYITAIPRFPARTMEQVKLKTRIWPVFYEAQNHRELREEAQRWSPRTVRWFRDSVGVLRKEAKRVRQMGEVPVVSYVPASPHAPPGSRSFLAHDTRVSSQHPLRHSVLNLIRSVGDAGSLSELSESLQNGQNYLLTSLTLFTTHEPCIACSMALLHSRVQEVVYLYPMPKTGGCGSLTCVPGLKGVNHRYKIWKWREVIGTGGVEEHIDA